MRSDGLVLVHASLFGSVLAVRASLLDVFWGWSVDPFVQTADRELVMCGKIRYYNRWG